MSKITFKIFTPVEREFEIPEFSLILGRGEKSHVKIDDPTCSLNHCRITLVPIGLFIEDLRSKNGTHLNGLKIEKAQIFFDDHIRIGDTEFSLLAEKCSEEMKGLLTFDGTKGKRMLQEIKIGNDKKTGNPTQNLKTKPQSHQDDVTQLRLNPLFKDVGSEDKSQNDKAEKEKKKGFLDKINPFKK